jgi:hypothetical protein
MPEDAFITVETRWPKKGGKQGVYIVFQSNFPAAPNDHPKWYLMNHSDDPTVKWKVTDDGILAVCCDGDEECCE